MPNSNRNPIQAPSEILPEKNAQEESFALIGLPPITPFGLSQPEPFTPVVKYSPSPSVV